MTIEEPGVCKAQQLITRECILHAFNATVLAVCILDTVRPALEQFLEDIRAGHPGNEFRLRINVVDGLEPNE